MVDQGLIAFLDMLGYQNIIDNNDIERISELVSRNLSQLPSAVRQYMQDGLAKAAKGTHDPQTVTRTTTDCLQDIEYRLVSDSILLALPMANYQTHPVHTWLAWKLFLNYASRLCAAMFDMGLPVRGAVDYGRFLLDGHCFAGRPIVECYRLSARLDFAGLVLTEAAGEAYAQLRASHDPRGADPDPAGFDYLVPMKVGLSSRLLAVNWWSHRQKPEADVRQAVFDAFRSHKKDVPAPVYSKIQNTEFLIRAQIAHDRERANRGGERV